MLTREITGPIKPPMSPCASTSTSLMHRFGLFIERLKWTVVDATERHYHTLGPLSGVLWIYIGRTARRFAALHARFVAGKLTAPRPRASRPAAERAASTTPTASDQRHAGRACRAVLCWCSFTRAISATGCSICWRTRRCRRCSRPRPRRDVCCARCGGAYAAIRCPSCCGRRRSRRARSSRLPRWRSVEAPLDTPPDSPTQSPPGRRPAASGQKFGKNSAKPALTLPWSPPSFLT